MQAETDSGLVYIHPDFGEIAEKSAGRDARQRLACWYDPRGRAYTDLSVQAASPDFLEGVPYQQFFAANRRTLLLRLALRKGYVVSRMDYV
jgi:hypothetical protein